MRELQGIARFKVHEGKLEEFKRLSAQAMEIVRTKDTGTLQYDTYFNDDQSECVVLERFRDSEALIEHAANLGDLVEAILATVSATNRCSQRLLEVGGGWAGRWPLTCGFFRGRWWIEPPTSAL